MLISEDIKLDYSDVLIRPKRSTLKTRASVDIERRYIFRNSKREWSGVPIMAANMDTVGTFKMHEALSDFRVITCIAKALNKSDDWWKIAYKGTQDFLGCMAGISDEEMEDVIKVWNNTRMSFIGIDVANGYTIAVVDALKKLRERLPQATIVCGNVVTADMTAELILAGADIVKVGVGPGSVCTTRVKTGIGYPQLSAVIECADAAHGLGGHIIADGGCNSSGDIVKAFAAGADFVMIGGMLAGHDECSGELVFEDDNPEPVGMQFYGMASETAMEKHGKLITNEYRGSEGKTVTVPYRGPIKPTIVDILSGLRSACTYVGAKNLKQLSKCTTFVRVNNTHNTVYGV
tara:strand:+ start:270 stop:1313 length:1044 start_codon:yes stop_codon:yes gene_type:complete